MSNKMFLIFNKRTATIAHLSLEGTMAYVGGEVLTPYLERALTNMHDGEYFHIGHCTVSCSTGGITTDELILRSK